MKKLYTLLLSAVIILSASILHAQTNFYPDSTGTINGNGYTYKHNLKYGIFIVLYNNNDVYIDQELGYKDGTPMPEELTLGDIETISGGNMSRQSAFNIVSSKFTPQQKAMIGKNKLIIDLAINTLSGNVAEVHFSFKNDSPFRFIPSSVFRSIELALKQQMKFTLTGEGKKLNYDMVFWAQEIE